MAGELRRRNRYDPGGRDLDRGASRAEWPTAWREAASLGDMRGPLKPEQTAAMVRELEAIVERYLATGPAAVE